MKKCPWFKTKCKQHDCEMYINVQGVHPQTGVTINEWDCTLKWIPVMLMDIGRQAKSGAAATENFRNEMIRLNNIDPTNNLKRLT